MGGSHLYHALPPSVLSFGPVESTIFTMVLIRTPRCSYKLLCWRSRGPLDFSAPESPSVAAIVETDCLLDSAPAQDYHKIETTMLL